MKRFSKVIALVLAMVMVISMLPVFASAEEAEPVENVSDAVEEIVTEGPEKTEDPSEPDATESPASETKTPADEGKSSQEAITPAEEDDEEVALLADPTASYTSVAGETTEYETLSDAVAASQSDPDATASEGGTVTLLADYALAAGETGYNKQTLSGSTMFTDFKNAVTIDLGGHTLTGVTGTSNGLIGQSSAFANAAESVTLKNGQINVTGRFLRLGNTAPASAVDRSAPTFYFEDLRINATGTASPFDVVMPSFGISLTGCTVYTGAANPTFNVNHGNTNSAAASKVIVVDTDIYAFNAKSGNGVFFSAGNAATGCHYYVDNVNVYHGVLNAQATQGVFGKLDPSLFVTAAGDPVAAMSDCGQEITILGNTKTYAKYTDLTSPEFASATAAYQPQASDETRYYASLTAALTMAEITAGGGTVTLLKDLDLTTANTAAEQFPTLTQSLILDLGGHAVTSTRTETLFAVDDAADAAVTIQNGAIVSTGAATDGVIRLGSSANASEAEAALTLKDLQIYGSNAGSATIQNNFKNGALTIDGCAVVNVAEADGSLAVGSAHGASEDDAATFTIQNTRIYASSDNAIRVMGAETLSMSGVTIYTASKEFLKQDDFTGEITLPQGFVMDTVDGTYAVETADAEAFSTYVDVSGLSFDYKTEQVEGYFAIFVFDDEHVDVQPLPVGRTPEIPAEEPVKDLDPDALETYEFDGWSSDGGTTIYRAGDTLPGITKDVTYQPIFIATPVPEENRVTVTFLKEGKKIYERQYLKDTAAYYDGEEPTKAGNADYVYEFLGWSLVDDEEGTIYASDALPALSEDAAFEAQFKQKNTRTASYTSVAGLTTKYDSLTAAIQAAMADSGATTEVGGTVTLLNDIELTNDNFDVEKGNVDSNRLVYGNFAKAVTIDLGGNTITSTRTVTSTGAAASLYVFGLNMDYASKVVIRNGKLIVLTPSVSNSCITLATYNDWTTGVAKKAKADWTVQDMYLYSNASNNLLVGTRMPYSKLTVDNCTIVSGNAGSHPFGAYTTSTEFQPELILRNSRLYGMASTAIQMTLDTVATISNTEIYLMGTKGANKFASCTAGAVFAEQVLPDIGWGLEDCEGTAFAPNALDQEVLGEYLAGTYSYKWQYVERPVASWDTDGDGEADDFTTLVAGDTPVHENGERPLNVEERKVYFFTGWHCSTDDQVYAAGEILPAIGEEGVTFTAQFEEQEAFAAWTAGDEFGFAASVDEIAATFAAANAKQDSTFNLMSDYELPANVTLTGVKELFLNGFEVTGDYGFIAGGTETIISGGAIHVTASPAIRASVGDLTLEGLDLTGVGTVVRFNTAGSHTITGCMIVNEEDTENTEPAVLVSSGNLTVTDSGILGSATSVQLNNAGFKTSISGSSIVGGSAHVTGSALVTAANTDVTMEGGVYATGAVEPVFFADGKVFTRDCDIYPNAEYVQSHNYKWYEGDGDVDSAMYRLSRSASFTVPFVEWKNYYRLVASTPVAAYTSVAGATTQYLTLTEALKAAMADSKATTEAGGMVTLLQDLHLDETNATEEPGNVDSNRVVYGNFSKAVTIDLGGHTLSYARTTTSKGAAANCGIFGLNAVCSTKVVIQNGTILNLSAQSNSILVLSTYNDWTGSLAKDAKADWTFRNINAYGTVTAGNFAFSVRMPYAKLTLDNCTIVAGSSGTNTSFPVGTHTTSPDTADFEPVITIRNSRLYSTTHYVVNASRNATINLIDTELYGMKTTAANKFMGSTAGATYDNNIALPDGGELAEATGSFTANESDLEALGEYLNGVTFNNKWTVDTPDTVQLAKANGTTEIYTSLTEAIAAAEEGDTLVLDQNFVADAVVEIPDTLEIDTRGYALTLKAGTTVNGVTLEADTPINTDLNLRKVSLTLTDKVTVNVKFDSFVPEARKDGVSIGDCTASGSLKAFSFEVDKGDFATEYLIQATDTMAYGLPVKVSVLKYAQAAVAGSDTKLADMMTALMYYGDSEAAYEGLGEKVTTLSQYDSAAAGVLTATDFGSVTYAGAASDDFTVSYTDVYGTAAETTAASKTFSVEAANLLKELTITDGENTVTDTMMGALKAGGQLYAAIYGYYASQYFGK